MKNKLIALTAAVAVLAASAAPAAAFSVVPSAQKVTVNDKAVAAEVYNIDGLNYFKLRDVAFFLKDTPSAFAVGYDEAANSVTVTTGGAYDGEAPTGTAQEDPAAEPSAQTLLFDGKTAEVDAYNINGNNYFQLRDLGSLLGVEVAFDADSNTAMIRSKAEEPVEPVDTDLIVSWNKLDGLAKFIGAEVTSDSSKDGNTNIWYTLKDDDGMVELNRRVLGGHYSGEAKINGSKAVKVCGVACGDKYAEARAKLLDAGWTVEQAAFGGGEDFYLSKDGTDYGLSVTAEDGVITVMKLTGRQG